jgi:hypothetical protein
MVGVLITFFTMLFTSSIMGPSWYPYVDGVNYTDIPMWVIATLGLLTAAIPCLALFLLGLKILV